MRVCAILFLPIVMTVGVCQEQPVPETDAERRPDFAMRVASPAVPKHKPRTSASSLDVGEFPLPRNPRTRDFLKWANSKYAWFCSVRLNANEDITRVNVHPCYPVSDAELKVIAEHKSLNTLSFYALDVTDMGLSHLETLPRLRDLWLFSPVKVTKSALSRLKLTHPGLIIHQP